MSIRHSKVYGQNHIPFQHNDSISFRKLAPEKTKKQIKRKQMKDCWVPIKPDNSVPKICQGLNLVEKHINEGNKEEAQRLLNKIVFENEVKSHLDDVAAGIEFDLVGFIALDEVWGK